MIYCVIPPELETELYDRMVKHYENNPNVEVIIDRRTADRRAGKTPTEEEQQRREIRDRRRSRPGSFPRIEAPENGAIGTPTGE